MNSIRDDALVPIDATLAALCLSILDGKESAIEALANRMRELGNSDARLVKARSRLPLDTRIKYVLLALSSTDREIVAYDFVDHVLPIWEQAHQGCNLPRRMIETRRDWALGKSPWSALAALLPDVSIAYREHVLSKTGAALDGPANVLAAASSAFGLSFWCGGHHITPTPPVFQLKGAYVHFDNEPTGCGVQYVEDIVVSTYCHPVISAHAISKLAEYARFAVGRQERKRERAWQVQRLKKFIAQCSAAGPDWPEEDGPLIFLC